MVVHWNLNPELGLSGIYKISSSKTGRFYIGSTNNFNKRFLSHFEMIHNKNHHSRHLENHCNKHIDDTLRIEVVEIVLDVSKLIEREQYYLDTLNPFGQNGFNINRKANSRLGTKMPDSFREKVSKRMLGNKHTLGHKLSEDHKNKIRDSVKKSCANRDMSKSEESKEKMRKSRGKKVLKLDSQLNIVENFLSTKDASRKNEGSGTAIAKACREFPKIYNGHFWRYNQ